MVIVFFDPAYKDIACNGMIKLDRKIAGIEEMLRATLYNRILLLHEPYLRISFDSSRLSKLSPCTQPYPKTGKERGHRVTRKVTSFFKPLVGLASTLPNR